MDQAATRLRKRVTRSLTQLDQRWDGLETRAEKGPYRSRAETRGLARSKTQRLDIAADSDNAPPEVLVQSDLSLKASRSRLIAPMAGMISAALEISLLWPMEYAKVQLQLNASNRNFSIFHHIFKEQGFSIYRGLTPMLIGCPAQGAVRFTTLDSTKRLLADENGDTGRAAGLLAGMVAGVIEAVFVVTPVETVKTRLVDSKQGIVRTAQYVLQRDGITGIYKGVGATIVKSATNQALRFGIYEECKRIMLSQKKSETGTAPQLTALEALAGGMTTGCLAALINYPIDVIKTRMQGLEAARFNSIGHCLVTLVTEEGVLSLYSGVWARLARTVPGQGIIFCSYETISREVSAWLG